MRNYAYILNKHLHVRSKFVLLGFSGPLHRCKESEYRRNRQIILSNTHEKAVDILQVSLVNGRDKKLGFSVLGDPYTFYCTTLNCISQESVLEKEK